MILYTEAVDKFFYALQGLGEATCVCTPDKVL